MVHEPSWFPCLCAYQVILEHHAWCMITPADELASYIKDIMNNPEHDFRKTSMHTRLLRVAGCSCKERVDSAKDGLPAEVHDLGAVLLFQQVLAVTTGPSTQRSARPTLAGTCPPHPGFVHGMCIRCGASVGKTSTGPSANVSLRYSSYADKGYQPTVCWHD